jgi:hypothetical protein
MKQSLEPLLGTPDFASSGGARYSQMIGPWFLMTDIDFTGHARVSYSHDVTSKRRLDNCPTALQSGISLFSWCGIHRETSWI